MKVGRCESGKGNQDKGVGFSLTAPSSLQFGRRCFQLRRCGAVKNRTYRVDSPDFSIPGRRGFLTSPIGSV